MTSILHLSLYPCSSNATLKLTPIEENLPPPPLDSEFIHVTNECQPTWHNESLKNCLLVWGPSFAPVSLSRDVWTALSEDERHLEQSQVTQVIPAKTSPDQPTFSQLSDIWVNSAETRRISSISTDPGLSKCCQVNVKPQDLGPLVTQDFCGKSTDTNTHHLPYFQEEPPFSIGESTCLLLLIHMVWMTHASTLSLLSYSPRTTTNSFHCPPCNNVFRGQHMTRQANQNKAWDLQL